MPVLLRRQRTPSMASGWAPGAHRPDPTRHSVVPGARIASRRRRPWAFGDFRGLRASGGKSARRLVRSRGEGSTVWRDRMITKFSSLYAGHVDLGDMGQDATPANDRRY